MIGRSSFWAFAAVMLIGLASARCGSRTATSAIDGPPECLRDEDCDGAGDRCFPVQCRHGACEDAAPISCDDKDPCTSDVCEPRTGACLHPDATVDLVLGPTDPPAMRIAMRIN